MLSRVSTFARVVARSSSPLTLARSISMSPVMYNKDAAPPKKGAAAAAAAAAAPAAPAAVPDVPLDSVYAFRGIPGRYSKVLLEHARRLGQIQTVRKDLADLDSALQSNYEFRAMFHRVPLEQLEVSDITKVFLDQLRTLGHTHHFGGVVKNFEAAARELLNEQHLTIVTAKPLPASQLSAIKDVVARQAPGSSVVIKTDVDESIIGGIVVHSDELVFDVSLKTLLRREFAALEAVPAANQEKRMRAMREANKTPEFPASEKFEARVRAGVLELQKQAGLNEVIA